MSSGSVRRTDSGTWEARYYDPHGRRRGKTFKRKFDAENFLAENRLRLLRGDWLDPQKANIRFSEIAEQWRVSIQERRRPSTVAGYEQILDRRVLPAFGWMRVAAITYADVDGWVSELSQHRAASTVRNNFYVLKQVVGYARRQGHIAVDPCDGIELPSPRSPKMLFLTEEQVHLLAAGVDQVRRDSYSEGESRSPYGLLVRFAAYTGLRSGELMALRVGDLDLKGATVSVSRSVSDLSGKLIEVEPKTVAGRRTVSLPSALATEVAMYLGERRLHRSLHIFLGYDGQPIRHRTFYRRVFKPAVRAVLPVALHGIRFHDLRHTCAAILIERGAHPKEMAEWLGHASVQITLDRYGHLMPHLREQLSERLNEGYLTARSAVG